MAAQDLTASHKANIPALGFHPEESRADLGNLKPPGPAFIQFRLRDNVSSLAGASILPGPVPPHPLLLEQSPLSWDHARAPTLGDGGRRQAGWLRSAPAHLKGALPGSMGW